MVSPLIARFITASNCAGWRAVQACKNRNRALLAVPQFRIVGELLVNLGRAKRNEVQTDFANQGFKVSIYQKCDTMPAFLGAAPSPTNG